MSSDNTIYRALFPAFYSPRRNSKNDIDNRRRFLALRLPNIRLMGPMWSVGVQLRDLADAGDLPGLDHPERDQIARTVRLLRQMDPASPQRHDPLEDFRMPALVRAEVDRFLQVTNHPRSESRMSLLGVDTIPKSSYSAGDLKPGKLKTADLPVSNGQELLGDGAASIIAMPFGEATLPNGNDEHDQYLPAMQLLHGAIRFKAADGYLARLREKLALEPPRTGFAHADEIFLLPDGFCIPGALQVPWAGDRPVSGWFKATHRRRSGGLDVARVLRLWTDIPAGPKDTGWLDEWQGHTRNLEAILRKASADERSPRCFEVGPNAELGPEKLFWPETDPDQFMFGRVESEDHCVSIDGDGLSARLADRPVAENPLTTLTLQPEYFVACRAGTDKIQLTAGSRPDTAPEGEAATYRFLRGTESNSERLEMGCDSVAPQPVKLAVPLIETAQNLRASTGLPEPEPGSTMGLLWTFVPVRDGWLHMPLPNATAANVSTLLDTEKATSAVQDQHQGGAASGALSLGNKPGQPTYDNRSRDWAFSISNPSHAFVSVTLSNTSNWMLETAEVALDGLSLSFDGVMPITPFRQTPERLLPDHADRALNTVVLRGVSPHDLRGLEARMWRQAGRSAHANAPRVSLSVQFQDFAISIANDSRATIALETKLSFETRMSGRPPEKKTGSPQFNCNWSDGMRPWIWARLPSLPSVQTLPMAVAGAERNAPSGVRELAPLQLVSLPTKTGTITYQTKGNFDVSEGFIDLDVKPDGADGPRFLRPGAGKAWKDEIGMAVTTLPSLTLFAGLADNRDGSWLPADISGDWAGLSTAVTAELRHDIALRDEHMAMARAPGKAVEAKASQLTNPIPEPVVTDARFTPIDNNGPDTAPARHTLLNGWPEVWQQMNRRAALAALDGRDMVNRIDNKHRLVGVFGEVDYELTHISLDLRTRIHAPSNDSPIFEGSDASQLVSIGEINLALAGYSDVATPLSGLPSERDLTGLRGMFDRNGKQVEVTFGTANLQAEDGHFLDQTGLHTSDRQSGNTISMVKLRHDKFQDDPLLGLVTLVKPITATSAAGSEVKFWCSDVPIDMIAVSNILGAFVSGSKPVNALDYGDIANSAGLRLNHIAGFRWSLNSENGNGEFIVIDGLVFQPLELSHLDIIYTPDGEVPTNIVVEGRLRLPVGETQTATLPQAEGRAQLTLNYDDDGGYIAALTAADVLWPLKDPNLSTGPVPRLEIPVLQPVGEHSPGTLHYRLGDTDASVLVELERNLNGTFTARFAEAEAAPDLEKDDLGKVWPWRLSFVLSGAYEVTDASASLRFGHKAELIYQAAIGQKGARCLGECRIDLLDGTNAFHNGDFQFSKLETIPIAADLDDAEDPAGPQEFSLTHNHLALSWGQSETSLTRVLGGLKVSGGKGSILAVLKEQSSKNRPSRFEVIDLNAQAEFDLETTGLAFSLDNTENTLKLRYSHARSGSPDTGYYRLFDDLKIENAFSWPAFEIDSDAVPHWDRAHLPVEVDTVVTHEATLQFDGQRIAPKQFFDDQGIAMPVAVQNNLRRTDGRLITWRAFQVVRLYSMAAFLNRLDEMALPLQPETPNIHSTGLSPLMSADAKPHIDFKAKPHFLRIGAVNSDAVSGNLARIWADFLRNAPPAAMAIDLSDHVLHAFAADAQGERSSQNLVLTGLPGVAFAAVNDDQIVRPADIDHAICRALESRPSAELTVYRSEADRIAAQTYPPLAGPALFDASQRLAEARATAQTKEIDTASLVMDFDATHAHLPVFQTVVFRDTDDGPRMAAEELPGAGTAFHLSELFGQIQDATPLVISFSGSGRIEATEFFDLPPDSALHPLRTATWPTTDRYRRALGLFRKWVNRNIVLGPDGLSPAEEPTEPSHSARFALKLATLNRAGDKIQIVARQSIDLPDPKDSPPDAAEIAVWSRRTLQRAAPWAKVGLLTQTHETKDDTTVSTLLARSAVKPTGRVSRTKALVDVRMPGQGQRQRGAPLDAADPGVMSGYQPLTAAPHLFASDSDALPPGTTDGPRLTATGVDTSWTLAGDANAILQTPGTDTAYWIADRDGVAFRPAAGSDGATTESPSRLTFALPKPFGAKLPSALLPAANGLTPPIPAPTGNTDGLQPQNYAPAYVTTRRISARAGAWTSTRTGLIQREADRSASLRSSETPVHVRQPRPPLLALNDRPRASSHEGKNVDLRGVPTAILYGPRQLRVGEDPEPTGLNRAPRSRWATRLALLDPYQGILPPVWNGKIALAAEAHFGQGPGDTPPTGTEPVEEDKESPDFRDWTVAAAALILDGLRYEADLKENHLPQPGDGRLNLKGFVHRSGSKEERAIDAIKRLPPAQVVTLALTFHHNGQTPGDQTVVLNRQVRFDLLTSGQGRSEVERPLFFRFEDPEFNDRLGGLAKLDRVQSAYADVDDFVQAAEVKELRPDQQFEMALALRPAIPGAPLAKMFTTVGTENPYDVLYDGKPVFLQIERRRPNTEGALQLSRVKNSPAVIGVSKKAAIEDLGFRLTSSSDAAADFLAFTIDCNLLIAQNAKTSSPVLLPGDQLGLIFKAKTSAGSDTLIDLVLDVVEKPSLPANPSGLGILQLADIDAGDALAEREINVHLFANGPEATVIELVDPRDLVDGLVRRRAVYHWRSFAPTSSVETAGFALQKINAVGGSWIPNALDVGWQRLGPVPSGQISGLVFLDAGETGQSTNQPKLDGITVKLIDVEGSDDQRTQSSRNGEFSFAGLHAGTYRIAVEPDTPGGRRLTVMNQGSAATDSDLSPETSESDEIKLRDGEHVPDIGIGLVPPS